MNLSPDVANQVFSLPAPQRFALAQQLLDSINDVEASRLDQEFIAELSRRREEMLRGEGIVTDWRAALQAAEGSLKTG